jgi:hypothetical protein
MNTQFLAIIKRILSEQGEAILADPKRLKGWVSDYAQDVPKAERLAFGRCIEYGAYTELKAPVGGRAAAKNRLVQRLHNEEGLDRTLSAGTLDVLEAAVWGEAGLEAATAGDAWVTVAEQRGAGQKQPSAAPPPVVQAPPRKRRCPQNIQNGMCGLRLQRDWRRYL